MMATRVAPTAPRGTMVVERICPRCGKSKPVAEFGIDRSKASGRNRLCKQCVRMADALRPYHDVAVTEKRCATCGKTKPASEFWRNPVLKDGLMSSCKVCARKRQAVSFWEWQRSEMERHPEKVMARRLVREALKSGKLIKPIHCEACGKELPLHAHHTDYDKPLEVTWLCQSCHVKLHIGLRRGVA